MRKTIILFASLLMVCSLAVGSFAAETEKEAAPAKKVEEKAGPKVTFSGDVQYRSETGFWKSNGYI